MSVITENTKSPNRNSQYERVTAGCVHKVYGDANPVSPCVAKSKEYEDKFAQLVINLTDLGNSPMDILQITKPDLIRDPMGKLKTDEQDRMKIDYAVQKIQRIIEGHKTNKTVS